MKTLFARHTFAAVALVGWALACHAQSAAPPLQPGQFVREGSSGQLTLKRGPNGILRFAIDAQGDNGPDGQLKFPHLWPPQIPPGKTDRIMTIRD